MSTKISGSPRLATALEWAAKGYRVFPLKAGTKAGQVLASWKTMATTDPATIRRWWAEEDYNVATALTGEQSVADTDSLEAEAAWDSFGRPETLTIRTPRGGCHYHLVGRLPNSVSKGSAGLDTRGEGGYVLLPGSTIDGVGEYRVIWDAPPAPVPEGLRAALGRREAQRQVERKAPNHIDKSLALSRAREWLSKQAVPQHGVRDEETFKHVAKLRDFGLEWDDRQVLIREHGNEIAQVDLNRIQDSVDRGNVQNRTPGVAAPSTGSEAFKGIELPHSNETIQHNTSSRFTLFEPTKGQDLPDVEFWDAAKTLPKGAIIVAYGPSGDLKTTLLICDCLDAADRGARVLFAAGEGSHGFRKHRLPQAIVARGKRPQDYDELWRTCPVVPLLTSNTDVSLFIETVKAFKPNIVIVDTLAAASGGMDENSSAFGSLLTSTGPLGQIRAALGCTVIVVHHTGKDLDRGSRGHSSIKGNADSMWLVTADKAARRISKFIEKMRDGADGFTMGYTYSEGLPIAKCAGRVDKGRDESIRMSNEWLIVRAALEDHGARDLDTGMTTHELACLLVGRPETLSDNEYHLAIERREKSLDEGSRPKAGRANATYHGLVFRDARPGSKGKKWFSPHQDPTE